LLKLGINVHRIVPEKARFAQRKVGGNSLASRSGGEDKNKLCVSIGSGQVHSRSRIRRSLNNRHTYGAAAAKKNFYIGPTAMTKTLSREQPP